MQEDKALSQKLEADKFTIFHDCICDNHCATTFSKLFTSLHIGACEIALGPFLIQK